MQIVNSLCLLYMFTNSPKFAMVLLMNLLLNESLFEMGWIGCFHFSPQRWVSFGCQLLHFSRQINDGQFKVKEGTIFQNKVKMKRKQYFRFTAPLTPWRILQLNEDWVKERSIHCPEPEHWSQEKPFQRFSLNPGSLFHWMCQGRSFKINTSSNRNALTKWKINKWTSYPGISIGTLGEPRYVGESKETTGLKSNSYFKKSDKGVPLCPKRKSLDWNGRWANNLSFSQWRV